MFWNKKKIDKDIKDQLGKYGELIRNNHPDKKKKSVPAKEHRKNIPRDYDRGFVYYEE